jgi:hypothetical protein
MLDRELGMYACDRVDEIECLASDIPSDDLGDIFLIYSLSSRLQERDDLEGVPDAMSEIWRFLPLLSYRLRSLIEREYAPHCSITELTIASSPDGRIPEGIDSTYIAISPEPCYESIFLGAQTMKQEKVVLRYSILIFLEYFFESGGFGFFLDATWEYEYPLLGKEPRRENLISERWECAPLLEAIAINIDGAVFSLKRSYPAGYLEWYPIAIIARDVDDIFVHFLNPSIEKKRGLARGWEMGDGKGFIIKKLSSNLRDFLLGLIISSHWV